MMNEWLCSIHPESGAAEQSKLIWTVDCSSNFSFKRSIAVELLQDFRHIGNSGNRYDSQLRLLLHVECVYSCKNRSLWPHCMMWQPRFLASLWVPLLYLLLLLYTKVVCFEIYKRTYTFKIPRLFKLANHQVGCPMFIRVPIIFASNIPL